MKWIVFVLTLAITSQTFADDSVDLEEQMDIARAKAGAGGTLTVLSVILGVTGGVLLGFRNEGDYRPLQTSLGLGISSAVLATVGIPLAVIGAHEMRALKKRKLAVGPTSLKLEF